MLSVQIQQLIYDLELLNTDEDIQEPNHNKYSKVNPEQHEYSRFKADSVEIITGFQKLELKLILKQGNPNKCKKLSVHF